MKYHAQASSLNHIELLMLTGCRKSQCYCLKSEDDGGPKTNFVEFKDGVPHRLIFRWTKTGPEWISVTDELAEALMRFQKDRIIGNGYLFPCMKFPERRTHITDNGRLLQKLAKHADIPRLSHHDLRRTHANAAIRAGLTKQDVSRTLNHKNVATTEEFYLDKSVADQAQAESNRPNVARVTGYIADLIKSA
jgi:integrase